MREALSVAAAVPESFRCPTRPSGVRSRQIYWSARYLAAAEKLRHDEAVSQLFILVIMREVSVLLGVVQHLV